MNALVFTVPGQPVAKGRPKFARRGNFVSAYTPEKTANYETLVKWSAREAMEQRPPFECALHIELDIMVQAPASLSKKRMAMALAGEIAAIKRPDMDNIIKGIFDGLLGVVFKDDAQVTRLFCVKRYAATPGVEIRIMAAGAELAQTMDSAHCARHDGAITAIERPDHCGLKNMS